MKRLFSISPKDGKGGEVTGVFEKHSSDAGLGSVRRWRHHPVAYPLWLYAGEWAPDALVLLHWTLIVSVCREWHQPLREPQLRQMLSASAVPPLDASGDRKSPSGAYWTASDGATDARTPSVRRVYCSIIYCWNFDLAGHMASSQASDIGDCVCCNGDRCI
jgi:hypothetical protein